MSLGLIAVLVVVVFLVALIFYGVMIYNHLIAIKNNVAKNWSNIEVLLKQRNNELSKLIDTCSTYMKYEQDTLQKIVQARKTAIQASQDQDLAALGMAEGQLLKNLRQLFGLAENYPDLKASQVYQVLATRISDLENSIADRRELFNDSVNINNIRINIFPDLIIARLFSFPPLELLKFQEDELKDVDIKGSLRAP